MNFKRYFQEFLTLNSYQKKPLNDFGGASNEEEETFLTQASQRSATFVLDGKL